MKITSKLVFILGLMLLVAGSAFATSHVDTVTVGAQSGAVNYGTAGSATFAVSGTGSGSGNVTWSLTGTTLPTGATASFSPATATGGSPWTTTLTISTTNTTPAGSTVVKITSDAGTGQGSNTFTVGKRTVTGSVGVSGKVYDRLTSATITNRSLTGVIGGDAVSLTGGTANFSDKNVGAGKTVTVTNLTLTGAAAASYVLASTTVTTSASITAKALTVSATGSNKVYNATVAATVGLADNRISGDVLSLSYASALFDDKNVGTNKNISVTGINVTGTDSGNYTFNTTDSTTANITARSLAVSATGVNKIYDGTTNASVTLSNNAVAGDDISADYTAASFSDKDVGTTKPVNVTGISLTGADTGNYTFNATAATTANITAKAVTASILADNKVYDRNTSATITNRSLTGVVSGDTVTVTGGTATFNNKNVGSGKTVTETGLGLSGADAGDYTLASTNAATLADITARALTVSATGVNKVYDSTTNATVNLSDDRLSGDVLTTSYGSASFADKNVANGKTVAVAGINVTGADSGNYSFNSTTGTSANITAKGLTVTATGVDKVYDGNTNATVNLGGDAIITDDITPGYTAAAFADKNIGAGKTVSVTGIDLTGADAGNYSFNHTASTTASITAKSVTASIMADNKVYDSATSATVTNRLLGGVVLGDTVSLAPGSADFDTKDVGTNKTVTEVGLGLTGAGAGNYTLSNTNATTLANITGRTLTVTATASSRVYDGTTNASVTLDDDRVVGDVLTVNYAQAAFGNKNVGSNKTVTVTGINLTGADSGNYTFDSTATTTANITIKTTTATILAANKAYDGTTAATITNRSASGVVAGDTVVVVAGTASFDTRNVGTGKTVTETDLSLGGADGGNYSLTSTTATTSADITLRSLVVSATGANKVYDGNTSATVTLSDNRVAGDVLTNTYVAAAFDDKNAGTNKHISVTGINVTGTDVSNYSFNATASATASILGAQLTITADDKSRMYGAPNPAFTVNYSGFISGEGLGVLSGFPSVTSSATVTSTVAGGPYSINPTNGSLVAPNYSFVFVSGLLTITQAKSTNVVATSANPSLPGTNVTFSAIFTAASPSVGTPTGTAQFLQDGSPLGAPTAISNGLASVSTASLAHGYHTITVRYLGDSNFFGSTNSLTPDELINRPPTAGADSLFVVVNAPTNVAVASLTANDSDVDGDSFTLSSVNALSTQGGSVSLLGGNVTYTPPLNYAGADSFGYTLTDFYGATANGTVNVTVQSGTNRITSIVMLPDHNMRLTVSGVIGATYRTLAATNLVAPVWVPISTNTVGTNGTYTFDDLKATNSVKRFYRSALP